MAEVYEFFAGGGMVRAGLGPDWTCRFANDIDARKAASYRANWGTGEELFVGDVAGIDPAQLSGQADLAWASFPCQDLSLAGAGRGLAGPRSGAFHGFWRVIEGLTARGRATALVAIENVCGTLTSRGGADFAVLMRTLSEGGYRPGALVIDAERFVPQSRPRLFVIGVHHRVYLPDSLQHPGPQGPFHTPAVVRAVASLPPEIAARTLWWTLPEPPARTITLFDLIEPDTRATPWHTSDQTDRLLSQMSPLNVQKLDAARHTGTLTYGTAYRRTRQERGHRVQRAEVRFDGLAGCLRTPGGGSSRQIVLEVIGDGVRSRLMSPRETARLMGLPDSYLLPAGQGDALHLTGDGVVVPVVRHLTRHLFEPLIGSVRH
ncbi:DNA cytosine methyltransferase [Brevundimonas sp.]